MTRCGTAVGRRVSRVSWSITDIEALLPAPAPQKSPLPSRQRNVTRRDQHAFQLPARRRFGSGCGRPIGPWHCAFELEPRLCPVEKLERMLACTANHRFARGETGRQRMAAIVVKAGWTGKQ